MLDGNKINDINEIAKYGKAKGYLIAKRYKLPTYSNFYIVENEDEIQTLLDTYKEQENFCMRADTAIGNVPIKVGGQNGNRVTIFEYMKQIMRKAEEVGTKGVAIIYWNHGKFCPTYETDGCFYLDYRTGQELIVDYIGKGWDGSFLSHGSACHETYVIPWKDILFLDATNRIRYRKQVVSPRQYNEQRIDRINKLVKNGISREIAEKSIPNNYKGINNNYFRQVVEKVVLPMYDRKDLQRHYKEYIPIAQIENGKVLVPEVILPERLKYKEIGEENEER